jgi:AcrR family transcriptional regulator
MAKEAYIPCLLDIFRRYGYDGATLSKISQATGLGKASLYHYFPHGKDEMVSTVLDFLEKWFQQNILEVLRGQGTVLSRLSQMCERVIQVYEGGEQPCMCAILLMGSGRDIFHAKVNLLLRTWIDEIARVLQTDGLDQAIAKERAEDALIAIQGALILVQGLNDTTPFLRIMKQLPQQICRSSCNM